MLLSLYSNDNYRLPYFFQVYVKNLMSLDIQEEGHEGNVINSFLERRMCCHFCKQQYNTPVSVWMLQQQGMIPAGNGAGSQCHTKYCLFTSSTPNFSPSSLKQLLNHFGPNIQTEFVFAFKRGLCTLNSSFLSSVFDFCIYSLHIFVS